MKVKGYGEMQFKFFMKKAPLAVKNFVTLASNGYFDGQIFHRVINDFMIQSGDPTGTGTGGESIWGEDFDNEVCEELLPLRGSLCMANSGADTNGSQFLSCRRKQIQRRKVWKKECRAHKETTSVILGSGWISILNRKLYCVWTNDQWI